MKDPPTVQRIDFLEAKSNQMAAVERQNWNEVGDAEHRSEKQNDGSKRSGSHGVVRRYVGTHRQQNDEPGHDLDDRAGRAHDRKALLGDVFRRSERCVAHQEIE